MFTKNSKSKWLDSIIFQGESEYDVKFEFAHDLGEFLGPHLHTKKPQKGFPIQSQFCPRFTLELKNFKKDACGLRKFSKFDQL